MAALVCLIPFAEHEADARSCPPPLSIEREFALSSAVFVGTITALEVDRAQTVATFSVERAWKGVSQPNVRVATHGGSEVIYSTSLSFKSGERYVVFAKGAFPNSSSCDRTGTETHYLWNETMEWLQRQPATALKQIAAAIWPVTRSDAVSNSGV